jgi:excisionase family DNA binding protein
MKGPHRSYAAPGWLMANEAAAILQVSPKTVSRWASEGKLPYMRTLGGHRRYPEAEIRQLLADHTVEGDPFSGIPRGGPGSAETPG